MLDNPLSTARHITNIALVLVMAAFVLSILSGYGPSASAWIWIIAATCVGGVLLQLGMYVIRPGATASAWDEQTQAQSRASYAFGYWMAMVGFLGIFAGLQTGLIADTSAFLWLAPILAVSPPAWMALATLRGRAG